MYDIRQFRPVVYILVFTGITGYALATSSVPTWVLAATAILLNAWLVRTGRFGPMPRLLANIVTVIALLYSFMAYRELGDNVSSPILVVAQFLVVLQIVKLYEQRSNRDYAQLLVLSLLLMVASAISTSKLEFGVLFIIYMFLALYACLLFHLKVETDHAKHVIGVPEERLNPMTLKQDQRYLPRSMRRLTGLVSLVAIAMAIVVFLFFPRGIGAGMLGPMQQRNRQALTGFSDQMNFQQVAQITQNPAIVAYVKLWDEGQQIEGTRTLMLRGATLDIYTGNSLNWQWQRSTSSGSDRVSEQLNPGETVIINDESGTGKLHQEVMLEPNGTEVLFALPGITHMRSLTPISAEGRFRYQSRDQSLRLEPQFDKTFRYEAFSTGEMHARPFRVGRTHSVIDSRIEDYARKPEISGEDTTGSLAARREKSQFVTSLDELIAGNIAKHLMGEEFSYTLDLSDAARVKDRDPVVAFLYDLKRGHCEYFAGAMCLMCQSLGMQARVVIGFKCDEFNEMTHSYVVRQSHAHAWVEVLNDKMNWITFDPTSGREAVTHASRTGARARIKQFLDYLEYTWATRVVAYDKDSRTNVIQNVDSALGNSASNTFAKLRNVKSWFDIQSWLEPTFTSKLISILLGICVLVLLSAVTWFAIERWRLRRRAKRIGLGMLPADDQLRLARQLGFYDELLRLLARHRITSPDHLTPMEFSRTLSFLPNEVFDTIRRLTDIFYRVRFGQMYVGPIQQRKLKATIDRVEKMFERPTA